MSSNEWPISYLHYIPSFSSSIEMMRGAMKAVQQCAGVKKGENVVISTDTNKLRIAEAWLRPPWGLVGFRSSL